MNVDHMDIAYLAIGADQAWGIIVDRNEYGTRDTFDGIGQAEAIRELLPYAEALTEAWAPYTKEGGKEWDGRFWYYDVSEQLGYWFILEWDRLQHMPPRDAVLSRLTELVKEAQ